MVIYPVFITCLACDCPDIDFIWANYTFFDFICFLKSKKIRPVKLEKGYLYAEDIFVHQIVFWTKIGHFGRGEIK